ncbi:MAG: hypothetical protein GMKNLPBB_00032 [Myxococcota bacterium]|nr:hypothetical protein [Myxococcota bacterium]
MTMDATSQIASLNNITKTMGRTCACFNLRRATRAVTAIYDREFRAHDITANQFTILAAVVNMGELPVGQLAEVLGMDQSTLSRNLIPLKREGWLSLHQSNDRRERRVCITQAGAQKLMEAAPTWNRLQNKVQQELGTERTSDLLAILRQLSRV